MSWWTKLRDTTEKGATLGFYDPVKSRHEEADMRYAINDQIKSYKEQSELSRELLNKVRNEEDIQKKRIQEKQIRAMRRNYRPTGTLLGSGGEGQPGMTDKLGG